MRRYFLNMVSKDDRQHAFISVRFSDENGKLHKETVKRCGNVKKLLEKDPQALEKLRDEVARLNRGLMADKRRDREARRRNLANPTQD